MESSSHFPRPFGIRRSRTTGLWASLSHPSVARDRQISHVQDLAILNYRRVGIVIPFVRSARMKSSFHSAVARDRQISHLGFRPFGLNVPSIRSARSPDLACSGSGDPELQACGHRRPIHPLEVSDLLSNRRCAVAFVRLQLHVW